MWVSCCKKKPYTSYGYEQRFTDNSYGYARKFTDNFYFLYISLFFSVFSLIFSDFL